VSVFIAYRENNMKKAIFWVLALLSLSGCVTSPIPENYSGPLATIRDTTLSETPNRAQFFYLSEIDGQRIENVLIATRKANAGRGFSLTTVSFSRDVPAKASAYTLEGRISYGAPIQEILNSSTVYTVQKTLTFTPESNKTYVVRGTLTADRKEIWLEEAATGKRVE
jgi:hypothetical protein